MKEVLPELLTRAEAQTVLRISKTTILKLINQGTLPAKLIGNRFYIEKKDLISFISSAEKQVK